MGAADALVEATDDSAGDAPAGADSANANPHSTQKRTSGWLRAEQRGHRRISPSLATPCASEALSSRLPHCWQYTLPAGLWLPQAWQSILPGSGTCLASTRQGEDQRFRG